MQLKNNHLLRSHIMLAVTDHLLIFSIFRQFVQTGHLLRTLLSRILTESLLKSIP